MKKCIVENCGNKYYCKGYCQKHYDAFRVHGNPLIQKQFIGENRKKNCLYGAYLQMKNRCNNPNSDSYKNYGGRGIKIESEWLGIHGFTNFCKDMGEKPVNYTLDRIDNNGNYCKNNCRWADKYTQARNKRGLNKTIGVGWHKKSNKYRAYIEINNKQIHLGFFNKEEDAIKARLNAEVNIINN